MTLSRTRHAASLLLLITSACAPLGPNVDFGDRVGLDLEDPDSPVVLDTSPDEDAPGETRPEETGRTPDAEDTDADSGLSICGTVDPNERNDTDATATDTLIRVDGDSYNGLAVPLHGPRRDRDVYMAEVPAGCQLTSQVAFVHGTGTDVDVQLRGSAGNTLGSSTSTGNSESITWSNNGSTTRVFFDVYLFGSSAQGCTEYDITMDLSCGGGGGGGGGTSGTSGGSSGICPTDPNEPNNAIGGATPAPAVLGTPYNAIDVPLDGNAGDVDVYEVAVPPGCLAIGDLAFLHADGDIDVRLTDVSGVVLDSSAGTGNAEQVRWANGSGGPANAYLEVYHFSQAGCQLYDVGVTIDCPPPCGADPNEPNDDVATSTSTTAAPSAPYAATGVSLDGLVGDRDVYQVTVPPGCEVVGTLGFQHIIADIDTQLLSASSAYLDGSASTSDSETVAWANAGTTSEDVFMDVYIFGNTAVCTSYDVGLEVFCNGGGGGGGGGGGAQCGSDPFEPNDTPATATATGVTATTRFSATGVALDGPRSDRDFYRLLVPPACTARANIRFSGAVDVDMRLRSASGTVLDTSAGVSTTEQVEATNITGAPVWLAVEVYPWSPPAACEQYDIGIELLCP